MTLYSVGWRKYHPNSQVAANQKAVAAIAPNDGVPGPLTASRGLKVAFRDGHIKMAKEPSRFPAAVISRTLVADLLKR
jgi:hypothetical protein